jgi:hypothetical protein
MLDSVQLSLMMGPFVPLTPPRAVMDALESVEVTVKDVGTSGFQLTFIIDKASPLNILFLLTGGSPLLFMRVVLVATVNGVQNVLIDGVVTNHSIAPGDKGSNSTLTITGEDLTALMNQSDWSGFPFPACPAEARVALILAKYAIFGIIPLIIPSVLIDVPLPMPDGTATSNSTPSLTTGTVMPSVFSATMRRASSRAFESVTMPKRPSVRRLPLPIMRMNVFDPPWETRTPSGLVLSHISQITASIASGL